MQQKRGKPLSLQKKRSNAISMPIPVVMSLLGW
jgi:hypothetical protein